MYSASEGVEEGAGAPVVGDGFSLLLEVVPEVTDGSRSVLNVGLPVLVDQGDEMVEELV